MLHSYTVRALTFRRCGVAAVLLTKSKRGTEVEVEGRGYVPVILAAHAPGLLHQHRRGPWADETPMLAGRNESPTWGRSGTYFDRAKRTPERDSRCRRKKTNNLTLSCLCVNYKLFPLLDNRQLRTRERDRVASLRAMPSLFASSLDLVPCNRMRHETRFSEVGWVWLFFSATVTAVPKRAAVLTLLPLYSMYTRSILTSAAVERSVRSGL